MNVFREDSSTADLSLDEGVSIPKRKANGEALPRKPHQDNYVSIYISCLVTEPQSRSMQPYYQP